MYDSYRYFRAKRTGEFFCEKQLGVVHSVTGDSIDELIESGLLEEIKEPDVVDILNANSGENVYPAILRYKQLNNATTKDANAAIYGLLNMKKPQKFYKKRGANNDQTTE